MDLPEAQRKMPHSLPVTETSFNYVLFDGADTACIKRLGDRYWKMKDCRVPTLQQLYS